MELLQDWQFLEAGVAELADARDSKSRSFGSVGSIPSTGISSIATSSPPSCGWI